MVFTQEPFGHTYHAWQRGPALVKFDIFQTQPLRLARYSLFVTFAPNNADEVRELVDASIRSIPNTELAARIVPMLRPAVRQTLHWEYGNNEPFDAWRFAELGDRDVWAAYCAGGHGALGNPWGLIFSDSDNFGMDSAWYSELAELFEEWFA